MMAVIFPDIEKTLVAYFQTALAAESVRVGTKKAQPDETQPSKEIVLTVAYNAEQSYVMKTASLMIEVYAEDYATANELSLLVEALVRDCVGEEIKKAEVRVGPVRIGEESQLEKRYLDVGLVVKGTDL
jgi:N6-adenosine-specific RNA methylase IME4